MTNIGVFCSSLDGEKIFSEKAIELGALLAKENYSLVYGGGKLGLMGDLAKSVKKNDSEVISVIPSYLNKPNCFNVFRYGFAHFPKVMINLRLSDLSFIGLVIGFF